MYVYFIQSGRNGPIKIGKSNNPDKRMQDMQIGSAQKLSLIALIKCRNEKAAYSTEKFLYKFYRHYRIRGEWFRPSIPLRKFKQHIQFESVTRALDDIAISEINKFL